MCLSRIYFFIIINLAEIKTFIILSNYWVFVQSVQKIV